MSDRVNFKWISRNKYDALSNKRDDTIYFIYREHVLYKGDQEYGGVQDISYSIGEDDNYIITITNGDGTTDTLNVASSSKLQQALDALDAHIATVGDEDNTGHVKLSDTIDEDNLKTVLESIKEVSDSSTNLQNKFNEIYELTQTVSRQELTIMNAMHEQSEGGEQILEAIKQIQDVTASVKGSSDSMEEATGSANVKMENLMRLTEEITSSMDEMSIGIESINKAINEVNDMTHKNSESIESLGEAVSKFKV